MMPPFRSPRLPAVRVLGSRSRIRTAVAAALVAAVALTGVMTAGVPAAFAAEAPLASLTSSVVTAQHPKLLVTSGTLPALRTRVQTDPLSAEWYRQLRTSADQMLNAAAPTFDKSSGNLLPASRLVIERAYTLGIAYLVSSDQKYANAGYRDLSAAAAFPDWNPAHFLDTAEMTHGMAIGYDWFYPAWTQQQRDVVRGAIESKGLAPAVTAYAASNNTWSRSPSNWNAVSNAGVGMGALAVSGENPTVADKVFAGMRWSIPYGLGAYGPDGAYHEGISYWVYGTSYVATLASSLVSATGTDRGILGSAGLSATAEYAVQQSGPSGKDFLVGDAYPGEDLTTPLLGLESLYGRYGSRTRSVEGLAGVTKDKITPRGLLWYKPVAPATVAADASQYALDKVYADGHAALRSGWNQDDALYIGMRASDKEADNGHDDLDAGTFVLDALGENWITDMGADSYGLPGYFSDTDAERWSYYRKRAEGQNRLVIDPGLGADSGPLSGSSMSLVRSDAVGSAVVADLTSAYSGKVSSYKRGVYLADGRKRAIVQDEVTAPRAVTSWWFAHTKADVAVSADGRSATLSLNGKKVVARVSSPSGAVFAQMDAVPLPTSPNPAGQSANAGYRKLAIKIPASTSYRLTVEFMPLRTNQTLPTIVGVKSLADWSTGFDAPKLASLSVNGVAVPSFSPATQTYDLSSGTGGALPVVSATAETGGSVRVTQATGFPGAATILVMKTGKPTTVVTVFFNRGPVQVTAVTASASGATAAQTADRNTYTGWSAAGDQWLQYDLGTAQTVSHAEIYWPVTTPAGTPFEVKVSTDGQIWSQMYSGTVQYFNSLSWASSQIGPKVVRYVRVMTHGSATTVNEVALYSDNLGTPATTVTPRATATQTDQVTSLTVGTTGKVVVQVKNAAGAVVTSGYTAEYTSSDPSIASVGADGTITALKGGTVRIATAITIGRDLIVLSRSVTAVDPSKLTLATTDDTYVQGGDLGNTVLGTATRMFVLRSGLYPQFDRYVYMGFDAGPLAGAEIESATLNFTGEMVSSRGGEVELSAFDVTGAWSAKTTTFNTKPTMNHRIGSAVVSGAAAARSIDVTDYLRTKAGSPFSIGLSAENTADLYGREFEVDSRRSKNPPTLVVQLKRPTSIAPAAPVITSSVSTARDGTKGSVVGTVQAPPGTKVDVSVAKTGASGCIPVLAAGDRLGTASVVAGSNGVAAFTVTADVPLGSTVYASARAGTVYAPRLSECVATTDAVGAAPLLSIPSAGDAYVQGGSVSAVNFSRSVELYDSNSTSWPAGNRTAYMNFDTSALAGRQI